jgi:hypothetical protein
MGCYLELDGIYSYARRHGKLKDIPNNNILVHLHGNNVYFAGEGFHRLAIALILGLKNVPVDVSLIFENE